MLTKNELKIYSSLLKKKFRKLEKKFIVEGKKIVLEGLRSNYLCEIVLSTNQFYEANIDLFKRFQKRLIRYELLKGNEFKRLSDTNSPQGIAAVFSYKEENNHVEPDIKTIVALESISDPGNLGTILRTCDWFGFKHVLISPDSADIYNPKVLRSTMGSIFHLNVLESENFYSQLKNYKKSGYKIVVTDLSGENVFELTLPGKVIIVFSSEAHGPSEELFKITDQKITIPKYGDAESLNVSSAAAVVLSYITRVKS